MADVCLGCKKNKSILKGRHLLAHLLLCAIQSSAMHALEITDWETRALGRSDSEPRPFAVGTMGKAADCGALPEDCASPPGMAKPRLAIDSTRRQQTQVFAQLV